MPNIVNALERVSTLDALREAFEIDHPLVRAQVKVIPQDGGSSILVEGKIVSRDGGISVGRFVRVIEMPGNWFRVYHRWISIIDDFAGNGIAWHHYVRALRYYHGVLGAKYVYMHATYDGPYAWGDFGFEFVASDWKLMMDRLDLMYAAMYQEPPPFYPSTATGLRHMKGPDGHRIGWEVIQSVHETKGELKMNLHFGHEPTLQFLIQEGILEA